MAEIREDPLMLALAARVPGFAGLYFDDDGRLTVAVVNESFLSAAVSAIRIEMAGSSEVEADLYHVIAAYPFHELASYRTLLAGRVFEIDGVIAVGVRESENRVRIGIASEAVEENVSELLSELRIPSEAVTFYVLPRPGLDVEPSSFHRVDTRTTFRAHTLQDVEPNGHLQGGWQLAIGSAGCTLGYVALRKSNADSVFITNSHCTSTPYGYDGGSAYQPLSGYTFAGSEVVDPTTYTCGFIPDDCREADVAMFSASAPIDLGRIARTTSSSNCESCTEDLTIDHSDPTISIVSRRDHILENERLHKIGRVSGWTYGDVEDTCDDYEINNVVKQCSDRIDYARRKGDSGAPVFSYNAVTGQGQARGIHYGYIAWPFADALMSRLTQIEKDTGELVFFDPGSPSVSIDGPAAVRTGLLCTWAAVPSLGIDPFDYAWTGVASGSGSDINIVASTSGWLEVDLTDWKGRTASSSIYITVSPSGPTPPGCTE